MKVSEASICIDCDHLFETRTTEECPVCGSISTLPLRVWVLPLAPLTTAAISSPVLEVQYGSKH